MMFDQDGINDMVQFEIAKAVSDFSIKYGGKHNFQKQKFLFDLFNLKVPNNGYAKMKVPKIFDEVVVGLPDEIMNDGVDYEDEFLRSWMTELPNLYILSAEPCIQDDKHCWLVTYQMQSASCFFTVTTKYWEDRDPQSNFYRADLS